MKRTHQSHSIQQEEEGGEEEEVPDQEKPKKTLFPTLLLTMPATFFYFSSTSPPPPPLSPLSKTPPRNPNIPLPLYLLLLLFSLSLSLLTIPDLLFHPNSPPPLQTGMPTSNMTAEESGFWRQPDGKGYRPCIKLSLGYRRESRKIVREGRRFVVALVSGGQNQQWNQIVDAVVIARVLGAVLVVPVLRVNAVWGDHSDFSQIFDVDHFIQTLRSDVHVVPILPPSHQSRPPTKVSLPQSVSLLWIRNRLAHKLNKQGVFVLKGLDSRLSKDLPLDFQKLRCKVAFHALRFAAPIRELGAKLANRMRDGGPFVVVHLRLEKDVWIRTGCLPGIGPEFDRLVLQGRRSNPDLLTGRLNLTFHQRHQAGLCPLNALEVARLLRSLGAPSNTRIYWAGGEPLGGESALLPLRSEFANLISKEMLATGDELKPYANKSSALAAIDFLVAMSSDVFVPSHGGNMARVMQGYRAYMGHMKFVRPNKHVMVHVLKEATTEETRRAMKWVHGRREGGPEERGRKKRRDVIAYPAPECMCRRRRLRLFL